MRAAAQNKRRIRPPLEKRLSKPRRYVSNLTAVAFLLWAGAANAQSTSKSDAPAYKPPSRGAPTQRVGGGTRGLTVAPPVIAVLAPDHTGYTTRDQPTLYWHLSKPTTAKIEIAVTDAGGVKRIAEHVLMRTDGAGIQALSLRDLNVKLSPETDYRWSVALVPETGAETMQFLASGSVRFVPSPETLKSKLAKSSDSSRAAIYAEEGYWYDAVDVLVNNLKRGPDGPRARSHLAALLKQGGARVSLVE